MSCSNYTTDAHKTVFDFLTDGIVVIDRNMKVLFANNVLLRWCGLSTGEITGIPYNLVFQQSPFASDEHSITRRVLETGESHSLILRHKTQEGTAKIYELNATPLFDDTGHIAQVVQIIKDVTERKALRHPASDRAVLKAMLDAFSGGVAVIDKDMLVSLANKEYLRQKLLMTDDVKGKPCYKVFKHSTTPCFSAGKKCPARETLRTGDPAEALHTVNHAEGKEHYIALNTYPVKAEDGTVSEIIEIVQDLTEKAELKINEKLKILKLKEEIELLKEEIEKFRGSKGSRSLTLSQLLLP